MATLQFFDWRFEDIRKTLPELINKGIRYIHVSPPNLSMDVAEWWGRYQPLHYFIIEGPLGNKLNFIDLCRDAKDIGIGIIADAVINHMADRNSNYGELRFGDETILMKHSRWNNFAGQYLNLKPERQMLLTEEHFFTFDEKTIIDYTNLKDVVYSNLGTLPDLDIHHPEVKRIHEEYLKFLVELGVSGIRIDAAKHLPIEYVKHMTNVFLDLTKSNPIEPIVLIEIIASNNKYDTLMKPYVDGILNENNYKYVNFYNFPLLHKTKSLFDQKLSFQSYFDSYQEQVPTFNALQFSCNHDIPYNECFKYLLMDKYGAYKTELLHILMGHGRDYLFIDKKLSDSIYSFQNRKSRYLWELLSFKQRIVYLPPIEQLWSDNNNFWIGYRIPRKRNFINSCVIVFVNNTNYRYKVHSTWPSNSIFACFPNGQYKELNTDSTIDIKNGRLHSTLTLNKNSIVVFEFQPDRTSKEKTKQIFYDIYNEINATGKAILHNVDQIDTVAASELCKSVSITMKQHRNNVEQLEKELYL